jgi:hypothetical protein
MALDIYWQEAGNQKRLGSLEIDTSLENLLFEFGKASGITVDPYGKSRLYPAQLKKLIEIGSKMGYPIHKLKEIESNLPADSREGLMVLMGD